VVVLASYYALDAARLARRHDVAVHLPAPPWGLADYLAAPVERFEGDLADTGSRSSGDSGRKPSSITRAGGPSSRPRYWSPAAR